MNLFEYEGKQFLRRFSIPTPGGSLVTSDDAPAPLAYPFVIKAQVMTGGRGKAGGVKICQNDEEFQFHKKNILHMAIKGHPVHGLLCEALTRVEQELYISITQQGVDVPTLIFSRMGGMDIEAVAKETPEEICKLPIDPFTRLKDYQKKQLAARMPVEQGEAIAFVEKLQSAFFDGKAVLAEINPLGVVDGKLIALDSKVILDDHARASKQYLQELESARGCLYGYQTPEKEATTVTYVPLQGDIGMISDGAGTGMLTLDLLTDLGLDVACFTELGGMTTEEVMYRAMELTLKGNEKIKALLIVLIGGFNRMDNMARGIVRYASEHNVTIPIFTRMCGTMEEEGIQIMKEAGLATYYDLTQTAMLLRAAVKGA